MLRLEVLDYAGPARWRWRLTQADGGAWVADHEVELDPGEWQFEAFTDLHRYLRWNAAPDRRLEHEAELVAEVGAWIGQRVLGPVGAALARARRPVRVEVPAEAGALAYLPWELARVDGRALARHRVNFIIDQLPHQPLGKTEVGERLRMLAVFSLPEDAGALNLRKERHALARLVHDIAAVNHKAIELRVLQYGATRQRLEDALLEQPGWDMVHLSGHGLRAGLVLEDDTGRHDLITSTELVDLLDLAADQIKLVTLSACESAAVTATEHLHLLGLAPATRTDTDTAEQGEQTAGGESNGVRWLPAVATELVRRLDCAVLAMRYPVVDDFAIALAGSFYNLVLGKGQPVARALALTLSRVAPDPPTPSAPALSVATPALFGPRAGDLQLIPPAGGPVVFQTEQRKLAEFLPQPDRFVGRVGPMTRATTALAPHSGRVGVLFHGMAGAGKTACALELAYTHQDSFPLMAWHAAPPEGHAITTALSEFTLALERQLPGLTLAHVVADITALRQVLPSLTEALEQTRVLIVLDNIESLLTGDGAWRDERWALLVAAMTNHQGLSRLVLTSRRRPTGLPESMLIEPVHALSLPEAVLLAREWPHLRALIDATAPGLSAEAGRGLAARTLAVVQGHPKLIELADGHARNPDTLTARLDEADQTWLTRGTRLEPFLHGAEPTATDQDYLTVLDGWTRATTAALPPDAAILFAFLCCLEEQDRIRPVIDGTWADLWQRLDQPGKPPDPDTALVPLVDQALVAVDANPGTGQFAGYHIHPGVAETGRAAAGAELAAAVDTELIAYWLGVLQGALGREHDEQLGWLVLRAARAVAPYLLRQHRWNELDLAAATVLSRDDTSATVVALLPILAAAAEATCGTEDEVDLGRTHARFFAILHPDQAETLFRQFLDTAVTQEKFGAASALAGDLVTLYSESGRLDEALTLADTQIDYTRRAGRGPWTQLADQGWQLQVLYRQGHYQQVLDAVEQHRATIATLPDPPDDNDSTVTPWNVRESLLNLGALAARRLERWQLALDLNTEVKDSERRRGATETEQARSAYNDYPSLVRLGRVIEARDLLRRCRDIHESHNNISSLSKTFGALADVEQTLGHVDRAIQFAKDGLRFAYLSHAPEAVGPIHSNLALYLDSSGADQQRVWAHCLAAAVIFYQIGSGHLAKLVSDLARFLARDNTPEAPGSFAQVCEIAEEVDGVHLADLVAQLPQRAPDGQTAMNEVLRLAHQSRADQAQRLLDLWEPVISALLATHHDDPAVCHAATQAFDRALTVHSREPDWQALVAVLRRIHAGDRDPSLTEGLDEINTAITDRALDALAGATTVDPDAWHILTTRDDDQDAQSARLAASTTPENP